jgi:hypothetical protein
MSTGAAIVAKAVKVLRTFPWPAERVRPPALALLEEVVGKVGHRNTHHAAHPCCAVRTHREPADKWSLWEWQPRDRREGEA